MHERKLCQQLKTLPTVEVDAWFALLTILWMLLMPCFADTWWMLERKLCQQLQTLVTVGVDTN